MHVSYCAGRYDDKRTCNEAQDQLLLADGRRDAFLECSLIKHGGLVVE